jgi:arsenate reductase
LSGLSRRSTAEAVATGFLVATVVGSGIAAERSIPGEPGLQLLVNALATAGGLVAIILAFGSVSGAHLNPVITLVDRALGGLDRRGALAYAGAQVGGACAGAVVANLMFDLPAVEWSTHERLGWDLAFAEFVATLGLVLVVFGVVRSGRAATAPFAVAGYIGAAYFFTSSTSFANPAVTVGRMLSDTFAGIEPASVPPFLAAQVAGGLLGFVLVRFLFPDVPAGDVVMPTERTSP